MTKGVDIEDILIGEGPVAQKGDTVTIRCQCYLSHGDLVPGQSEEAVTFPLGRRRVIAGLEKGTVGMRVGGKRRLRISPHLAYRASGLPGRIPPNAVLVYDVELVSLVAQQPDAEQDRKQA